MPYINIRDIMGLWIPVYAELFVSGRNEKHSDEEIEDDIRGFEIDAKIDMKGEWYDDICKRCYQIYVRYCHRGSQKVSR